MSSNEFKKKMEKVDFLCKKLYNNFNDNSKLNESLGHKAMGLRAQSLCLPGYQSLGGVLNMKKFTRFFLLISIMSLFIISLIFANNNISLAANLAPAESTYYTSGKLNKTELILPEGESFTLEYTNLKPTNASNKYLYWATPLNNYIQFAGTRNTVVGSDANEVRKTGPSSHSLKITAKKLPTNMKSKTEKISIYTSQTNSKYEMKLLGTCEVKIIKAVTSIKFESTSLSVYNGDILPLPKVKSQPNGDVLPVTYKSSNTSVISVDTEGNITAKKVGPATITATFGNKTAKCSITVKNANKITSISLNNSSINGYRGNSFKLTVNFNPTTATNKSVDWSSSKTSVATVDTNGNVKLVGTGEATITAKSVNMGKTATCKIKSSNPIAVTGISLSRTTATIKGIHSTINLTPTISPSNATDKTISWDSSDTKIATVTGGTVKAVGVGKATITAKTSNNRSATCEITVKGMLKKADVKEIKDAFIQDDGSVKVETRVNYNGINLKEGTDYKVEYSNQKTAGQNVTITIKGIGKYENGENISYTKKIYYNFNKVNLNGNNISYKFSDIIYNGNNITLDVDKLKYNLKYKNKSLTYKTDFKVENCTGNTIGFGKGKIKVIGLGNYKGENYAYFDIPYNIANAEVKYDERAVSKAIAENKSVKAYFENNPNNLKVYYNGTQLVNGVDYNFNVFPLNKQIEITGLRNP